MPYLIFNKTLRQIFFKNFSRLRNLIYHFNNADWIKISTYSQKLNKPKILQIFDIIYSSWNYGSSFVEYYEYNFPVKSHRERKKWLTASLRYEITRQINDPKEVIYYRDKLLFKEKFKEFLGREIYSIESLRKLSNRKIRPPSLLAKPRYGYGGKGIFIFRKPNSWASLFRELAKYQLDNEEYLFDTLIENQHITLTKINPYCLNTIRITTLIHNDNIQIISKVIRMSNNKHYLDNFGKGGLAATITDNGVISGPAVNRDPFDNTFYYQHPITKATIINTKLPYWNEIISMLHKAHLKTPNIHTVGWDIAIKSNGPCIIEGNSSWGPPIVQIPANRGIRDTINKYVNLRKVYD